MPKHGQFVSMAIGIKCRIRLCNRAHPADAADAVRLSMHPVGRWKCEPVCPDTRTHRYTYMHGPHVCVCGVYNARIYFAYDAHCIPHTASNA